MKKKAYVFPQFPDRHDGQSLFFVDHIDYSTKNIETTV